MPPQMTSEIFSLIARAQISSPDVPGSIIILGCPVIFSPCRSVMKISDVWSKRGATSFLSIVINIYMLSSYILTIQTGLIGCIMPTYYSKTCCLIFLHNLLRDQPSSSAARERFPRVSVKAFSIMFFSSSPQPPLLGKG